MIEIKFSECKDMTPLEGFECGYTDYMLRLKCQKNGGWLYADLMPRGSVPLPPAAVALGICAEETVRIGVTEDNKCTVFRLDDYLARLDSQAKKMGLPAIDRELTSYGLRQLISLSRPYILGGVAFAQLTLMSVEPDPSVYPVRDAWLTVTVKKEQPRPLTPISVCTSENCYMSHPHKFGALFAFAVRAGLHEARERGCDNVLWLDSTYMRYIDSLAGMDVFFHVGERVVYAGDGFTADSARTLMEEWGIAVEHARISTDQLVKEYNSGRLKEAFAVSTHDTVMPLTRLDIGGTVLELPRIKLAKKLHDTIVGIQSGQHPDSYRWVTRV